MISINAAIIDLKQLELMADLDSPIHSLDASVKVIVTFVFIISVISYGRYEIYCLLPFCIFPAVMIALSGLPPKYIARKIALVCPLILMLGMFNPVFDTKVIYHIGQTGITGGWISLLSLAIRSLLTVTAAFVLVGTTGFTSICQALNRLGVPKLFSVQLLFLHRYIFVLADETARASRARELRSNGKKGSGINSLASLAGHLLIRTWERAERIYNAMQARGFAGQFHAYRKPAFGIYEIFFLSGWLTIFITLRSFDITEAIGTITARLFQ